MTTVDITPDGQTTSGTPMRENGTNNLAAGLTDGLDTTYVVGQVGAIASVSLTTFTLPAGCVTSYLLFKYRSQIGVGGNSVQLVTDMGNIGIVPLTGSAVISAQVFQIAVNFVQSNIDNLAISMHGSEFTGASIMNAFVTVVYATQPTVVVSGPLGTITTSTTANVTWSYTQGSDGGPQSAYRIRVFTAAQYGAGGFDPASSASTYDSGDQAGSATSALTGSLPNNTTMRAYVRVAQTINGALHYSTWQFTPFAIAITVPTVTVTAPTGSVTTTTVPVATWTYTAGSNGGLQTVYRTVVFTAAQYGIGGFDPNVSPNSYDSGDVVSAVLARQVGPLANTTTFRTYVRVATTINGAPYYSAFAFLGFSIAVTTADISTVVATPDNTNARHSVLISRNTGTPLWTTIDLQRSSDAGATWLAVRGATGLAVSGATATVLDYESMNGTGTLYRARASYVPGSVVTGAWVTSSSTSWTAPDLWLKDIYIPARNQIVNNLTMPEPLYDRPQGVFRVIGSAFPVVISDVQQAGVSVLTMETYTDVARDALKLLCSGTVLLMQAPTAIGWGNRYVVPGALVETRMSQQYASPWLSWSLTLTEVAYPLDAS